jgi:uncharacterized protein
MTVTFLYVVAGVLTGILAGFFGVGGGIILVPMLVWFFKYSQHQAQGISLAALLLPVGFLGVLAYNKANPIPWKPVLWIALGIFVGAYFGGRAAQILSERELKIAFGVLTIVAGIRLIFWG